MWLQKIQASITTRDTPLISFENCHSCILQSAWRNRMLDQIPLAEIEQISYQVANSQRSRNSLESLKRQRKLLEKTHLVSIFRCSSPPRNPVYARRADTSALDISLSSHRQSYVRILFSSRFISLS